MQRFRIRTLVDITRTYVFKESIDLFKKKQQDNFQTLHQTLEMRAIIFTEKDPEIILESIDMEFNDRDYFIVNDEEESENVQDYLNKSTIYVHSATYEPFGLVQVEAMAAGLPVVALDGKGNRELIQNGSNGFMVSKVDPIDFAEKIIKIIENNQTYITFSNNSIDFAKKYDIVNYVDELLKIYN